MHCNFNKKCFLIIILMEKSKVKHRRWNKLAPKMWHHCSGMPSASVFNSTGKPPYYYVNICWMVIRYIHHYIYIHKVLQGKAHKRSADENSPLSLPLVNAESKMPLTTTLRSPLRECTHTFTLCTRTRLSPRASEYNEKKTSFSAIERGSKSLQFHLMDHKRAEETKMLRNYKPTWCEYAFVTNICGASQPPATRIDFPARAKERRGSRL